MKKDRSYSMRLKFTLHYELLEQVNMLDLENIEAREVL